MVPDAIDLGRLRRVLVIKLRHHGDVLLTSPVFQVLKNHAPHMEIDGLVYADTAEMLALHPAIQTLHCIDRAWKKLGIPAQSRKEWTLLRTLKQRRYDLLIHLTEHPRGAWLKHLLGARYGVARSWPGRGRIWRASFTHLYPAPRQTPRHSVELNLDALRRIGVYPSQDERRLVLEPGADARASAAQLLARHGLARKGFIHIHPTSRWLFKCWTAERMSELMAALNARGLRLVVTSAPDAYELRMVRAILAPLDFPVADLSGKLSLKQLAALTAEAKLFIGLDSAPMHIAAAMQTPTVVLFGPSGDKEWGPWMVPHRIVTSDHVCRPCGNDGCGGGKISECLTTIATHRVLRAVEELLAAQ
jgi:heptosyltransferase III